MVVGIGGSSNSGKSGLANTLADYYKTLGLKVKVLCQDDFVYRRDYLTTINDHVNWELPSTIEIDEYILAVKVAKNHNDIVLCEGLFAFWFNELNKLYDKTIFLKIDKETFIQRKKIDLRWGKEPDWYINHIWENHLRYGQHNLPEEKLLLLDAMKEIKLKEILNFVDL